MGANMAPKEHDSGSPFVDWLGIGIDDWHDGFVRLSLGIEPHHLNRSGAVHGGLIAVLLENGAGLCGLHCAVKGNRRYGMTLSLTCNFIGAAKGDALTVTGRRTGGGRKIYYAETEVRGSDGTLIASASSVHRYRTGSETPEGVPAD
jgi:uncharacterized protein (TIGR00369 family)